MPRKPFTLPRLAILLASLCLSLIRPAPGHPDDDQPAPGDWAALGFRAEATPTAQVDMGDAEFALAALAVHEDDPDLARLLTSVDAFSMRQFAAPEAAVADSAEALLAHLVQNGWLLSQLDVQDTRQVHIYVRPDGDEISGIVVVALDPGLEVTLAHVAGDIDPAQLHALGLPIPH